MEKVKILYEGLSNNLGGIETFVHTLYKNIDKSRYEISFLVDKNIRIPYQEEYEKDGCKFYRVENRKNSYYRYLKELKEVYKNNNFDVIHINIMSYSLFERITFACKYSKAKVIVHSHNGGFPEDSKYKRTMLLDKIGRVFVGKYNNRIIKIACGEKAGNFAFGNDKFTICNNGIDVEKFKFNQEIRNEIRKNLKIEESTTIIGLVAMFNNQKNHTFLIDIFNEYQKLNSNAKLMLIGEGYLMQTIKEKVDKLNLSEKVLFLGKRLDVNLLYSTMDIYIMPSLYEGLSISLCEAQINGLKCYTSNRADRASNITENVDFLSLEDGPKKWAEYIYKQNNDRDMDAYSKVPDKFNAKSACEKICKIYEVENKNV